MDRDIRVNQGNVLLVATKFHFPGGSDGKEYVCNVGYLDSIPGSGRSPGEEAAMNSSTLAWKIPWMERSDRLHRVAKNPTRLSDFTFTVQS